MMPCCLVLVSACSLLAAALGACAAAPAPAPVAPAASASTAPASAPPDAYSPYADPSFLTLQSEKNPYTRRILALLWVDAAKAEPPGAAREVRQKLAVQALSDAEAAVASQRDPCQAGVQAALDRANAEKRRLERRYLVVSEAMGDSGAEARTLDTQIHVLRDAIDELGVLAQPCPPVMFPDSDDCPQ